MAERGCNPTEREVHGRRYGLMGVRAAVGAELGSGFFNEVHLLSSGSVIKIAKSYGPLRQPLSWLIRFHAEHELSSRYLRVPPTYHVRLRDEHGRGMSITLQRHLEGRLLEDLSDEELYAPAMEGELQCLVRSLERCRRELGWLPDLIGWQLIWGIYDLRNSSNLLVDREGRIWLIDPSAFLFWFSRRNPFGWLYTRFLCKTARRLVYRSKMSTPPAE